MKYCHPSNLLVSLSPVHPFTRSPVHPFTRSPLHPFTPSPPHLVTLSPCHLCHLVTRSPVHLVTLSPCHRVTASRYTGLVSAFMTPPTARSSARTYRLRPTGSAASTVSS